MDFGERLEHLLKAKWKTLAEAARKLEVERTQLYPWINNEIVPSSEILIKLAHFGFDIEWLLTGKSAEENAKEIINKLESENEKLKGENYRLSLEVSQLSVVAEAVEGYNRLKHKKKG